MVRVELLKGDDLRPVWQWEKEYLTDWTEDEFVTQHSAPPWICWGIYMHDKLSACFSMEQQSDGAISVHVSTNRQIPFNLLKMIAKGCADELLTKSVPYLIANVPAENRAVIWLAKAAGFQEIGRTRTIVEMVRHG